MNLVVSDSGPIRYLVLCEAIGVIAQLYDELAIPGAVVEELTQPQTPAGVLAWSETSWLKINHYPVKYPPRNGGI